MQVDNQPCPHGLAGASLDDLPTDVLLLITRHLGAKELASLSVQTKRLNRVTNELWEPFCLVMWPQCVVTGYAGWRALFRARIQMPLAFSQASDKVVKLQQEACEAGAELSCNNLIEVTMQTIFSAGLAISQDKQLRKTVEHRRLCQAVTRWITCRPAAIVAFTVQANERMQEYDMWRSGFVNWPDTPWRRSAIAFFLSLVKSVSPWANPGLVERINRELASMDRAMRSIEEEADGLAMTLPAGIPREHWWYFLKGASSVHAC